MITKLAITTAEVQDGFGGCRVEDGSDATVTLLTQRRAED